MTNSMYQFETSIQKNQRELQLKKFEQNVEFLKEKNEDNID